MPDAAVSLTGNLTGDPTLRITPNGHQVVNFRLAVSERFFDKTANEWRDHPTVFIGVTAWRDLAENIAESLRKGQRVTVSGRLGVETWKDKDSGEDRSSMTVDATDVSVSLMRARARVTKVVREKAGDVPDGVPDAWATAAPSSDPAGVPAF